MELSRGRDAAIEQAQGASTVQDRREAGQQSFRIRKFSRHSSRSQRSESQDGDEEFNVRGISTSDRKIAKDINKTIDSEDEDGIVQHRERSRATRVREGSEVNAQIKLPNVNVPTKLDAKPANVARVGALGEVSGS